MSIHEALRSKSNFDEIENDAVIIRLLATLDYQKLELVSILQDVDEGAKKIIKKF